MFFSNTSIKKTILIIEDDDEIRSSLFELLELSDFIVFSAKEGFLGLQLAKKHQPDLIICDLNLPNINGLCVLKRLREDLTTATIPFIFITAEINPHSRVRAMELGANDYLIKPIDIYILLDTITNQLQGSE